MQKADPGSKAGMTLERCARLGSCLRRSTIAQFLQKIPQLRGLGLGQARLDGSADGIGVDGPHALAEGLACRRRFDPLAAGVVGAALAGDEGVGLHAVEEAGEVVLGEEEAVLQVARAQGSATL
jgi:hypothetical protein